MINSDSFLIYYPPGAYGTFLEWCLNFFTDSNFDKELPFNNSVGSSHGFQKVTINSYHVFDRLVNIKSWEPSIRIHPSSVNEQTYRKYQSGGNGPFECMKEELDFIYNNYTKKIVVLYYNMDSVLTGINHLYFKVSYQADLHSCGSDKILNNWLDGLNLTEIQKEWYQETDIDKKIKIQLTLSGADQHAHNWNKTKIKDLDRWELREFLSLYQYKEWDDQFGQIVYDKLQSLFKDIIFIDIQTLESNFKEIIPEIITHFNLPFVNQEQLDTVYTSWIKKQSCIGRNKLIEKIVEYTVKNKSFDFGDIKLTLFDEAFVQKNLRDRGLELKCYNLNVFPTNTINLRKNISG